MPIKYDGKYSSAVVYANSVDDASAQQITSMLNNPAITNPVRIMPDFHVGKGSVIGFTMEVGEYVVPNVVGVDIGCGMLSAQIERPNLTVEEMDKAVRRAVPLGFSIHKEPKTSMPLLLPLAEKVGIDVTRFNNSIGTLGGGNHFIEFGADSSDQMWVTIHSGSRNFGLQVANYHQNLAKQYCEYHGISVGKGLEFCPPNEYIADMMEAQAYASLNRYTMLDLILKELNIAVLNTIECVHNFIGSDNIIRKGAVAAYIDDDIILPFNRTEGIWIMKGLGNPDWNHSAPHGAGRVMSRGEAKRALTQEQVDSDMRKSGVYSSSNPVDESPRVYKDPKEIQELVKDTAKFLFNIKPILNIKG